MRAAILARKSTDDNDKNPDNKSVTRQVERGREWIAARGWAIEERHVYVDDDVSGADFKNRPGLLRLLNNLREIDVIVMSEFSRLGREQSNNGAILAQIYAAGVRVFFYLTGEEVKYDSAIDKFMVAAASFGAELEREKASQRARDALSRKAARGWNAGGRCYGYDNVAVYGAAANGQQVRTHTDYQINPAEAGVVRGIYQAAAAGRGLAAIAKALNGDPKYSELLARHFDGRRPPPPRKGTGSWAPSSVREILHRPRYTGKVPFGQHRKALRGKSIVRIRQDEYMLIDRPELRIVDEELWRAVRARFAGNERSGYKRAESKYLLSGLMRCEQCGGPMVGSSVSHGAPGKRRRVPVYTCSYAKSRGVTICTNRASPRIERIDGEVIDAIESSALTPDAIERVVELVLDLARAEPAARETGDAERRRLRTEIDRLIALTVDGRPPERVLAEIRARERRLAELDRPRAAPTTLNPAAIRRQALNSLAEIKAAMRADIPAARACLRQILSGPILLAPDDRTGYRFCGHTAAGALLTRLNGASPRGLDGEACRVEFWGPRRAA